MKHFQCDANLSPVQSMSSSDNNNSRKRGYSQLEIKSNDPSPKKHKTNQQITDEQIKLIIWLNNNKVQCHTIKKLITKYNSMYVYMLMCFCTK